MDAVSGLDFDAIQARVDAATRTVGFGAQRKLAQAQSAADVPALVAEVRRLTQLAEGRGALGLSAVFLADAIGTEDVEAARADYEAQIRAAAVAPVLDLHQPVSSFIPAHLSPDLRAVPVRVCGVCRQAGDAAVVWPCPTVRVLGVES